MLLLLFWLMYLEGIVCKTFALPYLDKILWDILYISYTQYLTLFLLGNRSTHEAHEYVKSHLARVNEKTLED